MGPSIPELISMSLNAIATLTSDPRLGGGGMRREQNAEMLQLLAVLVNGGERVYDELRAFAEEIQQMVDDNVQPSERHIQSLRDRSAAATAKLEERAQDLGMDSGELDPDGREGSGGLQTQTGGQSL